MIISRLAMGGNVPLPILDARMYLEQRGGSEVPNIEKHAL